MATFTTDDSGWVANQRVAVVTATFSSSYTSGGEALTAGDVGMDSIESVVVASGATASGYVPRYDGSAGTLQLFEESGAAGPLSEVAGATDVSSESVTLYIRGRS